MVRTDILLDFATKLWSSNLRTPTIAQALDIAGKVSSIKGFSLFLKVHKSASNYIEMQK